MTVSVAPELVRRLLIHEAGESHNQHHQAMVEATERACEKLRVHLTKRIGRDGFRVLIVRALTLTAAQFPHLSTVRVEADGTLQGLRPAAFSGPQELEHRYQKDADDGAAALVEHLVVLLITFIGEGLTLRLLATIWPTLSASDGATRKRSETSGREEETP